MYRLRELSHKDIKKINEWRADKELIDSLGAPYRYIDMEIDEQWYQSYLKNRDNTLRCAITKNDDDNILGLISLTSINYINRIAVLHIMIGKNGQGKGAGTFAINEILKYAFLTLNLNRIELQVLDDNERAKYLYKKLGFVEEGTKRQACYKDGIYKDMIIMGMLKGDYLTRGEI